MIQFDFQQAVADRQSQQAEQREAEWRRYVIQVEAAAVAPDPDGVVRRTFKVPLPTGPAARETAAVA